jgi:recombination protein RecR
MNKYPIPLTTLIAHLRKLPGVGAKTAERYAFNLLEWPDHQLHEFAVTLSTLKDKVTSCHDCGCFLESTECTFCDVKKRDSKILCIISSAKDVYPIEETKVFKGLYHVLGGLLSPAHGIHPENLSLEKLKKRIINQQINDVIIALDSTIEGEATALYLKEEMELWGVKTSRPAMGLPMGSSIDYVDGGTLARAIEGRQNF